MYRYYTTWPLVWSSFLTNGYTPSEDFRMFWLVGFFITSHWEITTKNDIPIEKAPSSIDPRQWRSSPYFFVFWLSPTFLSLLNYNLHNLRWKTSARTITSIQKREGETFSDAKIERNSIWTRAEKNGSFLYHFLLNLSVEIYLQGGGGNPPLISIMNDAWERIENIIIITRNPFPVFQFKKRKACRLCLQTPTNKNTAQQKKRLDGKQSWKGREKNGKLNSGETSRRTDGYPWWVESPAFVSFSKRLFCCVLLLLAEKNPSSRTQQDGASKCGQDN